MRSSTTWSWSRSYLAAILQDPDQEKVEAFLAHAPELVAQLEAEVAAGGFEGNAKLRRERGVHGDTAWTMAPASCSPTSGPRAGW
jgi:hypothetical protein